MTAEQERAPGDRIAEGLNPYPRASEIDPNDSAAVRRLLEEERQSYLLTIDGIGGTNLTPDARSALMCVMAEVEEDERFHGGCLESAVEDAIYRLCWKYAGIAVPDFFEAGQRTACAERLAYWVIEEFRDTDPTARAVADRFAEDKSARLFEQWRDEP